MNFPNLFSNFVPKMFFSGFIFFPRNRMTPLPTFCPSQMEIIASSSYSWCMDDEIDWVFDWKEKFGNFRSGINRVVVPQT